MLNKLYKERLLMIKEKINVKYYVRKDNGKLFFDYKKKLQNQEKKLG